MRIALVTYALQIGGVETFLKLLAKYFIEKGHEVDFIETLEKGKWSRVFSDEGYKVIQVLSSPLHSRIHHAKQIAKILNDYDLIVLNDAPIAQSILGLLPEKIVAIPVLHMYLTSMISNATANKKNWDILSTVSPAIRESAIHYGLEETKVVCIPNGIEVSDQWPKENISFRAEKRLKVIYIGSLNHTQKGILYLPGIFRKVAEAGSSVELIIIGDGSEKENLVKSFKKNCQNLDISMHGVLSNSKTLELLSKSYVLIMPSHFEGLPLVLLEAMASGIVPVVSRLAGCTDFVIENNVNGILVESGDEFGFANAIIRLNENRALLETMSKSAWETVVQKFSYETTGIAYLNLEEFCRQLRLDGHTKKRSGLIDKSLLGDFPKLPIYLVRPIRKFMKILGLYKAANPQPLLFKGNLSVKNESKFKLSIK
jgi:glycosyltransferase involved in cell wall biosynthesis